MKYINESDPLPATLSVGVFLALVDVSGMRWDISGDYIRHIEERADRMRFGTELVFFNLLAARGGVKFMEEIQNEYTLGFGLRLLGFEADFGTILNPQLNGDNVYQASISYKFPVKKQNDKYDRAAQKRADYRRQSDQRAQAAQERAERNTSPILYQ